MFENMENFKVDGVPVQKTQSWTPYNPTPLKFNTSIWDLKFPSAAELIDWYNNKMLGLPSISRHKYLTTDVELLQEQLASDFINGDEFAFMHELYELIKFKGSGKNECIFQMPEDLILNFEKLDESIKSNLQECYGEIKHGHTWSWSELEISPVERSEEEPRRVIIHNFKLACLFFMHDLTYSGQQECNATNLYKGYRRAAQHYWDNAIRSETEARLMPEKLIHHDIDIPDHRGWFSIDRSGFMAGGMSYTRRDHFVPISNILYFTPEELGVV